MATSTTRREIYYDHKVAMIEEDLHPRLESALKTQGKLGLYSYAPPLTRDMLELTHNSALYRALSANDPFQIRSEKALVIYFSTPASMAKVAGTLNFSRETIRLGIQEAITNRHLRLNPRLPKAIPANRDA